MSRGTQPSPMTCMCFHDIFNTDFFFLMNLFFHLVPAYTNYSLEDCKRSLCNGQGNTANYLNNECQVKKCNNGQLKLRLTIAPHQVLYKIPEYWRSVSARDIVKQRAIHWRQPNCLKQVAYPLVKTLDCFCTNSLYFPILNIAQLFRTTVE